LNLVGIKTPTRKLRPLYKLIIWPKYLFQTYLPRGTLYINVISLQGNHRQPFC
jgi:hypothetical protein